MNYKFELNSAKKIAENVMKYEYRVIKENSYVGKIGIYIRPNNNEIDYKELDDKHIGKIERFRIGELVEAYCIKNDLI